MEKLLEEIVKQLKEVNKKLDKIIQIINQE